MKNRFTTVIAGLAVVLGMGSMVFPNFSKLVANAEETQTYFSVEDYTNNDRLLKSDGNLSTKTITQFSDEVKNALAGADCSEITQVIPRQYMESTETNAVYQYNGKEYGFYMVKEGDYFDLLLIDFVYEFTDGSDYNNQYKIRIEPLLQQSFLRESTSDGYTWRKCILDTRYTYYVANPRFASGLLNENALNYGDADYSKMDDIGPIIQQMRVNYGKISYKTEEDYLQLKQEFYAEKVLDYTVDFIVDFLDGLTCGIASEIKDYFDEVNDYVEHEIDMYQQGREVTVLADNEKNIFTNLSREDQYSNPAIKGYSRAAYFMPKENEEIILSEADDSYAECIVVLNDTNQSCRLVQVCDFEIVRRQGNWSSMQYVAGGNEDGAFTFYKERRLFEETFTTDEKTMPYYLLPNGSKTFTFIPKYSGKYDIKSNSEAVNIVIDGVGYGTAITGIELVKDRSYHISFTSNQKVVGVSEIDVCNSAGSVTIADEKDYVKKYIPTTTGVYSISAQNSKLSVRTDLFGDNILLAEGNSGELLVLLQAGTEYYLVANNMSGGTVTTEILATQVNVALLENNVLVDVSCTANISTYCQFEALQEGKYDFVFYGDDLSSATVIITSSNGEKMAFDRGASDDCVILSTEALEEGVYYIHIRNTVDVEMDCIVNRNTTSYYWEIDGNQYFNGGIRRGATYTIELFNEYDEALNGRTLMVEKTYSDEVILEKNDSGYTLTISDDAKIFNNTLTYYCTIYVKDNKNIELSFPIIFQYEDLNLKGYSLDAFNEGLKIKMKDPTNGNETAKLYCSYNFDGGATIEDCIDINTVTQYDVTQLKNFSQAYFNIMDFTIKYIEIYDENTMVGKVYNSALLEYSGKVNNTYIESVDIGIHFERGTGTRSDPFIISDCLQFQHIEYAIKNGELNYSFFINSAYFWGGYLVPMFDCTLNGVFDGNNYAIKANSYDDTFTSGNKALFEKIGETGVVKNLNLSIIYNNGVGDDNSMAVVAVENRGVIKDCTISGHFSSKSSGSRVGCVVAKNYGQITNCKASGMINGGKYFGGIAGYNGGMISNCEFSGSMNYINRYMDTDFIGGIVGLNGDGTVSNCTFSGTITINVEDWESRTYQPNVGGIVGYNNMGIVELSTCSGTINVDKLNPDVTWWSWLQKKHFNQRGNVNELYNP